MQGAVPGSRGPHLQLRAHHRRLSHRPRRRRARRRDAIRERVSVRPAHRGAVLMPSESPNESPSEMRFADVVEGVHTRAIATYTQALDDGRTDDVVATFCADGVCDIPRVSARPEGHTALQPGVRQVEAAPPAATPGRQHARHRLDLARGHGDQRRRVLCRATAAGACRWSAATPTRWYTTWMATAPGASPPRRHVRPIETRAPRAHPLLGAPTPLLRAFCTQNARVQS